MQVVKMVMGPRPGLVIVKFWQGVVEMVLRILWIVFCVGAFIASAISLHHTLENLPDSNDADPAINRIDDIVDFGYNSLLFNARAASATGIAVSLVTILYEILPIVLRFLNIGFINYKIKIFLGIDVVISFVLASVLALVGILSAYLAVQWADLNNSGDQDVIDELNEIEPDALPRARNVYAATAGISLLAALFGSFLMTWVVFFLIQKWNEKVIKETVKSAVS